MSLPDNFINRIRTQSYIDADDLLSALKTPSQTSIRLNREKWIFRPAESDPVIWCPDGFYLNKRPSFTLDPVFHAGCYYPQESSGMFLEQVLRQVVDASKNIKALDLCGAPGGKATHLSSLIGRDGFLVTNEVIRARASVLAENMTKWGTGNTMVTRNDPSSFSNLKSFFDLILVDAPCSGEGMFRDTVAINEWSEKNTALCSERQRRILTDVWPALKDGGILIYSTCTFNPAENELIIKWLTETSEAETLNIDISEFKGITEIDYQGIRGYGFYPGRISGEGLFISVLRKIGSLEKSGTRFNEDKNFRLDRSEEKIALEWTGHPGDRLMKSGSEIIATPCSQGDFKYLTERLRVVKPGTRIGTIIKGRLLPDHELAMDINFRETACPSASVDYSQALAFLSREMMTLKNVPEGWINVRYQDVSLGFVNNIGKRLNNYYPLEWRIRLKNKDNTANDTIVWE
jgi:16S rRNA C967 or C1407 C5-methylase (RsmB/RsmF family)/NOL1/NOP2/fmu family ribosome biogenesis protein